ncbi:MAG: U32 family peptidase [Bacillota bacterium]|nr:U32 family peptidase [Bacillota bacterium]
MRKIPELLAPASGWQQLKAAINNGADAVYLGGALFNARMKADNFGSGDMRGAIDFAHERKVKVYVTLNTLIKDRELPKAFAYAAELWNMGADGLIIQDAGIARLIHNYLPGMHMHLSTQGTVYNRWGAEMAQDLGYRRIVPARELTLSEIKDLAKTCHARDMEVEVFVHGALCMCYSGQCQMSRLLGGAGSAGGNGARSGNRGLCAQPCRLMYADDAGRQSYALSPKDLCLIGDITALCQAGVDSFKIEGRLKSPEYVAVVTGMYRKYLDRYAALGNIEDYSVDEADMKILRQIFNRGGFTEGYLHGDPGAELLSGTSPKNTGLYAGKVTAVRAAAGKGASSGRKLIDIDVNGSEAAPLIAGDGIELPQTGNIITYAEELPAGRMRVGDLKGDVSVGDPVRKVTDRRLLEQARMSTEEAAGCRGRNVLDMQLTAPEGGTPMLSVRTAAETISVRGDRTLERAMKKSADPERLRAQLGKLGGTPFEAGEIKIRIMGDPMVPVSVINSMRREAVSALMEKRREMSRMEMTSAEVEEILQAEKLHEAELKPGDYMKPGADHFGPGADQRFRLIPLERFMREDRSRRDAVPYILNVSKGNLDRYIEDNFDEIADAVKDCGIACGNLGWIKAFQSRGIKVYGDYGLNVFNEQAAKAFAEAGVEVIAGSDELSMDGMHVDGGLLREPEIMRRVPLMITEHPLKMKYLTDRKGVRHEVLEWYSKDKYLLF